MTRMRTLLAVIALFALPACTPEEEAAVIADYAARMTEQAVSERAAGTITVDAQCDTVHVVIAGFPDMYRYIVGIGGDPPYGGFGNRESVYQVNAHGTYPYGYTVQVFDPNGALKAAASTIGVGPADC